MKANTYISIIQGLLGFLALLLTLYFVSLKHADYETYKGTPIVGIVLFLLSQAACAAWHHNENR